MNNVYCHFKGGILKYLGEFLFTRGISYPNTLKSFLDTQGIQADIHQIAGSVEIAPSIGLADGVCDIVSSGTITSIR